jgi:hypothetical protein
MPDNSFIYVNDSASIEVVVSNLQGPQGPQGVVGPAGGLSEGNIDGGSASSVYARTQSINGGTAGSF